MLFLILDDLILHQYDWNIFHQLLTDLNNYNHYHLLLYLDLIIIYELNQLLNSLPHLEQLYNVSYQFYNQVPLHLSLPYLVQYQHLIYMKR